MSLGDILRHQYITLRPTETDDRKMAKQHPCQQPKKANQPREKVDMRALKSFAIQKLPKEWPLREILLSDEDELEITVFLARLPLWLRLSRVSG